MRKNKKRGTLCFGWRENRTMISNLDANELFLSVICVRAVLARIVLFDDVIRERLLIRADLQRVHCHVRHFLKHGGVVD